MPGLTGRRLGGVFLIVAFVVSRLIYYHAYGLRFDATPIMFYLQYVDPLLLKTDLIKSIYYLHSQPPLFNLFLGVVLKVFPGHEATALHFIFLACGLVVVIGLYSLMTSMGVTSVLAAIVVAVFSINPVTLLYENWLFYAYPLTCLLILSAVSLHRYARKQKLLDAFLFFTTLAAMALTWGVFHFAWLLFVAISLVWIWRTHWRQLVIAAAIPFMVVTTLYTKNYLLFGTWSTGQVYQHVNLAMMTTFQLPKDERIHLIKHGEISRYNVKRPLQTQLVVPGKTSIPILDQPLKSTGVSNWHHIDYLTIGKSYFQDAKYVLSEHPGTYFRSIWKNVRTYFLPTAQTYPFQTAENWNAGKLRSNVGIVWTGIRKQDHDDSPSWILMFGIPFLFAYGAMLVYRWLKRRGRIWNGHIIEGDADGVTSIYCLLNILLVSVATLVLSVGDHNRYRFMLNPYFLLFLSMFLTAVVSIWYQRLSKQKNMLVSLKNN